MARGYTGRPGTTRTESVHFTCEDGSVVSVEVHRGVDVSTHPELGQRLLADDPVRALNSIVSPVTKRSHVLSVPVVYHDPPNRLFVLVMPETERHRELSERAALWTAIADARTAAVPNYVLDFDVVYGPAGLVHYLESQAEKVLEAARRSETEQELERAKLQLERSNESLAAQRDELGRLTEELDRRSRDLEETHQSIEDREAALDRRATDLGRRTDALAEAMSAERLRQAGLAGVTDLATTARDTPLAKQQATLPSPRSSTNSGANVIRRGTGKVDKFERVDPRHVAEQIEQIEPEEIGDEEVIVADQLVSDPHRPREPVGIADDGNTAVGGVADVAVERWVVSREPDLRVVADDGSVRLVVSVDASDVEDIVNDRLELRMQLHRFPSYPLVSLAIGSRARIRGEAGHRPFALHFDYALASDRAVLEALANDFTFSLELYDRGYQPVSKRTVSANLAQNVRYILAVADEHAKRLGGDKSFDRAMLAFSNPEYDPYGWSHPDTHELRDDKLRSIGTPMQVRRALSIARRFSRPEREEFLVLIRSFPLSIWHERRRAVVQRAFELGLWMGSELAQVAVSEGIARSKKDLVRRLQNSFAHVASDPDSDLDADAIADNRASLENEARALGLDTPGSNGADRVARSAPIASVAGPAVSGTIPQGRAPAADGARPNFTASSVEDLIELLNDKTQRLSAAVELCRRGDPRAVRPVFATMRRMTRSEAVTALTAAVGFGGAATSALIAGLSSHKGFLRQGCALALGVLRDEEGVEAIADLLIAEPTEIWREVARALGEIGPPAVMSLAARVMEVREEGAEDARERIAWALALISTRGGRAQVEALSTGRDPVAARVADRALELAEMARSDDGQVRGPTTPKDQTVNRAFSRRFFQALEGRGGTIQASSTVADADMSGPAMLLDEADLLEATDLDDDAEMLDENDLIPT